MTHRDPDLLELIKQGDPAPSEQMPHAQSAFGRTVRDRALATARDPQSRPTNTRRVARAILVIGLALAVAAAAWLVTREATEPRGAGCYEAPTLDSKEVIVALPQRLVTGVCAPLWETGTLTNPSIVNHFEVPPLVGCVSKDGGLIVFPSDDRQLCQYLGLVDHEPSPPDNPAAVLNQQLLAVFASTRCLAVEDAETQIEALLARGNIEDWTVSVTESASSERPCASFALDADSRTIRLVPIPEPPETQEP